MIKRLLGIYQNLPRKSDSDLKRARLRLRGVDEDEELYEVVDVIGGVAEVDQRPVPSGDGR